MTLTTFSIPDRGSFDLRCYVLEVLGEWISLVRAGEVAIHVPAGHEPRSAHGRAHFHAQPEVFLQIRGKSVQDTPRGNVISMPGDICLMPRGVMHEETVFGDGETFINLVVMHRPGVIAFHVSGAGEQHRPRILAQAVVEAVEIDKLVSYLNDAVDARRSASEDDMTETLGFMTVYLCGLRRAISDGSSDIPVEDPKIESCRNLVMNNLANSELTVQMLAGWLDYSPDYLSHRFRKATGTRLTDFINARRVDYARELLRGGRLSVSEVGWAVGYSDPGYFARVFKRYVGRSPREFIRLVVSG